MREEKCLRAFGSSFLGLPVIVAGADSFVPIVARRHTQALVAALVTEEEARLLVLCSSTPPRALRWAFCWTSY